MVHDSTPDSMALGEPIDEKPWARRVQTATVRLLCDWPAACPERILRGAVIAQVEETCGASVAWHNHDDNGDGACRMPEVLYRLRDGVPVVYLQGPRAEVHAGLLARYVHALRLPGGEVVSVDRVEVSRDTTEVQRLSKTWRRYETVTPLFPTRVQWGRRPREDGPERWAWAGAHLRGSIDAYLEACGVGRGQIFTHVHLHTLEDAPVLWDRPARDKRIRAVGFRARFVANAHLPDGAGLGKARSEGWGEVRLC